MEVQQGDRKRKNIQKDFVIIIVIVIICTHAADHVK